MTAAGWQIDVSQEMFSDAEVQYGGHYKGWVVPSGLVIEDLSSCAGDRGFESSDRP